MTAKELQKRILSQDVGGVAAVLLQSTSVAGIAAGLRIPDNFDFKENATSRNEDPDVVAIRSLALAMVSAGKRKRKPLAGKLADAIAIAVVPPSNGVKSSCQVKVLPVMKGDKVVFEEMDTCDVKDPPGQGIVNHARIKKSLLKKHLMQEILVSNAEAVSKQEVLVANGRSLKCSDCMNAYSYVCAYCYKDSFCDQFFWCKASFEQHGKTVGKALR